MSLVDDIKALQANLIPDNTNNEISPKDVRDALALTLDNLSNLGSNYYGTVIPTSAAIAGVAEGATVLPITDGVYTNLNNLERLNELCVFVYESGSWVKKTIQNNLEFGSIEDVNQLGNRVFYKDIELTDLDSVKMTVSFQNETELNGLRTGGWDFPVAWIDGEYAGNELTYTYKGQPFFVLGGDGNQKTSSIAFSGGAQGKITEFDGNTFVNKELVASFTSPNVGDVIKIISNNLHVYEFKIKRVGEADFSDWFSFDKRDFPTGKNYDNNNTLGFQIISSGVFADNVYLGNEKGVGKNNIDLPELVNYDINFTNKTNEYVSQFHFMNPNPLTNKGFLNSLRIKTSIGSVVEVAIYSRTGTSGSYVWTLRHTYPRFVTTQEVHVENIFDNFEIQAGWYVSAKTSGTLFTNNAGGGLTPEKPADVSFNFAHDFIINENLNRGIYYNNRGARNRAILANTSSLDGLKWVSYGDSITQQNRWQPKVLNRHKMFHTNKGIGGTKVSQNDPTSMSHQTRIDSDITTDIQILTIMGFMNDWRNDVPLGDFNVLDVNTARGAYRLMIERIMVKIPNARIVLLTNTYGEDGVNFPTTPAVNGLGLRTFDYADVVKEMGRFYSLPVVDMGACGWNSFNINNFTDPDDGGARRIHPNTTIGSDRMAEVVSGYLDSIKPIT